jgi:hypothetical protein
MRENALLTKHLHSVTYYELQNLNEYLKNSLIMVGSNIHDLNTSNELPNEALLSINLGKHQGSSGSSLNC